MAQWHDFTKRSTASTLQDTFYKTPRSDCCILKTTISFAANPEILALSCAFPRNRSAIELLFGDEQNGDSFMPQLTTKDLCDLPPRNDILTQI